MRDNRTIHLADGAVVAEEIADVWQSVERNYEHLYRSIQCLDEKERTVITLFYLSEKSLKEIKRITGIKIDTIKVILHRARKKLYHQLKPEYGIA